jgi:hypothetical protein
VQEGVSTLFGWVLTKLLGPISSLCCQRTHDLVRHFVTVHDGLDLGPPHESATAGVD